MAVVIAHIGKAESHVPGPITTDINFVYWVTMAWRIVSEWMV